jgi:cation transport regulator ChaC
MMERLVWVFFYGSYINFDVLREVSLVPGQWEVARLSGFDIRIEPRANLVRSERDCVYGIVATATHQELSRLYAHAKDVLGETYLPEAVLVETLDGKLRPALCYIATAMEARPAAADYIERIVRPAKEFGFPAWYVERLQSFLQGIE